MLAKGEAGEPGADGAVAGPAARASAPGSIVGTTGCTFVSQGGRGIASCAVLMAVTAEASSFLAAFTSACDTFAPLPCRAFSRSLTWFSAAVFVRIAC